MLAMSAVTIINIQQESSETEPIDSISNNAKNAMTEAYGSTFCKLGFSGARIEGVLINSAIA